MLYVIDVTAARHIVGVVIKSSINHPTLAMPPPQATSEANESDKLTNASNSSHIGCPRCEWCRVYRQESNSKDE
jgi:hypothetical protein